MKRELLNRIAEIDSATVEIEGTDNAVNDALADYLERGYESLWIQRKLDAEGRGLVVVRLRYVKRCVKCRAEIREPRVQGGEICGGCDMCGNCADRKERGIAEKA